MTGEGRSRQLALVTGGRRGLGRAIAAMLARDGFDVAVLDASLRGMEVTTQLVEAAGGACYAFQVDLADVEAACRAAQAVLREHGPVTVLVNNAGINPGKDWPAITANEWDRTLAVNLRAPLFLAREVVTGMKEEGWGRIVNIGSLAMAGTGGGAVDYSVSKAGLAVLGRKLATDLGPFGITVNTVAPGMIETEWISQNRPEADRRAAAERTPVRRVGVPGDIAEAVAFLASDRAGYITGQTFHVNGGTWMP